MSKIISAIGAAILGVVALATPAYAATVGATGSGTDTLRGVFTSPRTAAGGCDQSRSRGVIIAVGSGTASV